MARAVIDGFCVIVNAVAGSGKTTTIRHVAEEYTGHEILILMFNASLARETRDALGATSSPRRRAADTELSLAIEAAARAGGSEKEVGGVTASTVHAAMQNLYGSTCMNDGQLEDLVTKDVPPAPRYAGYRVDLLVFDEAQDANALIMAAIVKIVRDFHVARIVVLGDTRQCIYGYKSADARYLTHFDEILRAVAPRGAPCTRWLWKRLTLCQSFRVTRPVCSLINSFFGASVLKSEREGPRPEYHKFNIFQPWNVIKLIRSIREAGAALEDIALVAPSVKGGPDSPIARLCGHLPLNGIPVYLVKDENGEFHSDLVSRGKVLVTSIHRFKGRERKHIIVFGCDARADFFTSAPASSELLPNIWYVALTRSLSGLYVLHHEGNEPTTFVERRWAELPQLVTFRAHHGDAMKSTKSFRKRIAKVSKIGVCDLVRHTPGDIWLALTRDLGITVEQVEEASEPVDFLATIDMGGIYESSSAIIGSLVPMRLASRIGAQRCGTEIEMIDHLESLHRFGGADIVQRKLKRAREIAGFDNRTLELDCELALILGSVSNGNYHLLTQISSFSFVESYRSAIEACADRLTGISSAAEFEVLALHTVTVDGQSVVVHGLIDCVDGNQPYEFKTKRDLCDEDERQCLVYAALRQARGINDDRPFLLINSRTGERRRITLPLGAGLTLLTQLVRYRLTRREDEATLEGLATRVTSFLPSRTAVMTRQVTDAGEVVTRTGFGRVEDKDCGVDSSRDGIFVIENPSSPAPIYAATIGDPVKSRSPSVSPKKVASWESLLESMVTPVTVAPRDDENTPPVGVSVDESLKVVPRRSRRAAAERAREAWRALLPKRKVAESPVVVSSEPRASALRARHNWRSQIAGFSRRRKPCTPVNLRRIVTPLVPRRTIVTPRVAPSSRSGSGRAPSRSRRPGASLRV